MKEKPFLIFIVRMKKEKSLLLNFKKHLRIILKIGVFIIRLSPFNNKLKKANGILN
jgi:hypothetical protein